MSLVGVSYENINRLDEVTSLVGTELLVAAVNSRDRSVTVDTLANFVAIGSVTGPSSAVDSNLAAFDGITGDLIKDSGLALADIILRDGTVPYTGNQDFGGNDITNVVDITLEGVGAALRSGVNSNTRLEFSNAGIDLNSNNFTNFFIGGVQKGQLTDTLWLFQTDARFNEQVAIGGAVSGSEKLRVIGDAVVTGNFSQIAPITGFESKLGVHTLSGDVSFSSPTDGIFGSGAGYLAWNGENNRTSGYWAQNFNSGTGAAKGAFFGMVDDDVRIGSVADHKVQLQQNQSDRIVFLVNGEIEMFGQVKLNNILKFTSALGKIEGNNSAVNITLNEGNAGDLRLKSDVEIESTILGTVRQRIKSTGVDVIGDLSVTGDLQVDGTINMQGGIQQEITLISTATHSVLKTTSLINLDTTSNSVVTTLPAIVAGSADDGVGLLSFAQIQS